MNENVTKFTIYIITNLINGMFYIGQTFRNPDKRWREHKNASKRIHNPLYHAMQFYGIENFKFEILFECDSLEELNKKEEELISLTGNLYPNGYNLREGGDNRKYSEYSKKKQSESAKGRILSDEHKTLISATSKEMWSDENFKAKHAKSMMKAMSKPSYKEKQSQMSKIRWESKEYREKISLTRKGVSKTFKHKNAMSNGMLKAHAKPFNVYRVLENKELEFIGIWENVTICAKDLGLSQPKISSVLYKNRKSHKSHFFEYIEIK